jgi:hypothetical protein
MKYYKPCSFIINSKQKDGYTYSLDNTHLSQNYNFRTDKCSAFHNTKYPDVILTTIARKWLNQGEPLKNLSKTQISKNR